MTPFYRNVPKLGHVAVSRHAQKRMEEDNISQEAFERVLLTPVKPDVREGADILWRQRDGIRIVILENPTPPTGAKLVKTVYRLEAQAKATPSSLSRGQTAPSCCRGRVAMWRELPSADSAVVARV
jgi:hypothetical protein